MLERALSVVKTPESYQERRAKRKQWLKDGRLPESL